MSDLFLSDNICLGSGHVVREKRFLMMIVKISGLRSASRGFSLIEVLIVVFIVGILLAIAFPFYQEASIRTYRANGIALMQEQALVLKQRFSVSRSYLPVGGTDITDQVVTGGNLADLGGVFRLKQTVTANTFSFSLVVEGTGSASDRAKDGCYIIRMDQTGQRYVKQTSGGAEGSLSDSNRKCWK